MKKQLLTSTALVAAGAIAFSGAALAQGKPTLTLGGGTEQLFGVGENDASFDDGADANAGQRVGFDQVSDTEVHFNGSVTLDNGIKIRTRVELEGNTSGDQIDENWMRISGSFGEVRMGSGDPAGMAMTTGYLGTWSTGVGQLLAFDTGDWVTRPTAVGASTVARVDLNSDGEHISYFTPRFSGFQAGISWVPSSQEDSSIRSTTGGGDSEGWSFGVNYVGKFSGVGIGVAAGYTSMQESTVNRDDPKVWGIGGRIDFQGFRIGASWMDRDSQEAKTTGVTAAAGQETLELGARYTFGPNAVSITRLAGETTATSNAAGDGDETTVTHLAYRRTLGPGVSWTLTAIFADYENGLAGAAASTSNDGQALVTSVKIRF